MCAAKFRKKQNKPRRISDIRIQQAATQCLPIGILESDLTGVWIYWLGNDIEGRDVFEDVSNSRNNVAAKASLHDKERAHDP